MIMDDSLRDSIDLGDMSKLRVITQLQSGEQVDFAKDVAAQLEGDDARAVAAYLLHDATEAAPPPRNGHVSSRNGNGIGKDTANERVRALADEIKREFAGEIEAR